jgi:hypothetical protein
MIEMICVGVCQSKHAQSTIENKGCMQSAIHKQKSEGAN